MLNVNRRTVNTTAPLLAVLIVAALIVIFGPDERTLGNGIKSVYVHVPLTVIGRLALTLTGIFGAVALLTARASISRIAQIVGWTGLALLSAGFMVSLYSSYDNWGAIFWDEPRTKAVMQVIALTLIVQVLVSWRPPVRVRGLLHALMTIGMTWLLTNADLVLHPENPITTSNATDIQITFSVLILLCLASATWIVWRSLRTETL